MNTADSLIDPMESTLDRSRAPGFTSASGGGRPPQDRVDSDSGTA
jgi:hypothetical protein